MSLDASVNIAYRIRRYQLQSCKVVLISLERSKRRKVAAASSARGTDTVSMNVTKLSANREEIQFPALRIERCTHPYPFAFG
jgi:hypothetical protein